MNMKLEKVLLIDDSDIDNMVNKKVVERTGLATNVVVKNSASSALNFLKEVAESDRENIPDIIFLDIRMPEIDGFGFLEMFEKLPDPVQENISIVMLSSSIDSEDYNKAMQNRFVKQFLNKPLKKEVVAGLLNNQE